MKRPRIKTPCVADRHAAPCERIAEFSAPNGKGGLIAVRQCSDGSVVVDVYRCDEGVRVIRDTREDFAPDLIAALNRLLDEQCPFECDTGNCECGEFGTGRDERGNVCAHIEARRAIAKAKREQP